MADAEQVYRAHPTADEVAEVLAQRLVAAEGTARVISGAEAQEINHRLRAKYIKPAALDGIDRAWGRLDDVAVEITPKTWRSWTGSVLHEETRKELTGSYEDAWLTGDE